MRSILAAALVASVIGAASVSAQDAPANGAERAPAAVHPLGGYLPQPPESKHLLEFKWADAKGYPLYVLNRECRGQCAVTFPPLTPPAKDAKPPSRDWSIRIRDENGDPQWVYKGKPVYTFWQDKPDEPPKAHNIIPGVELAKK